MSFISRFSGRKGKNQKAFVKGIIQLICITILSGCQVTTHTGITTQVTQATIPASTPKPTSHPIFHFPASVNPLTGEAVADVSLLKIPALLISISHFPATARPQAGLSFAPYVYEYYITEGATRFLAVFYGEFPKPELAKLGGCETRQDPFVQTETLLGKRVWMDTNGNGLQDAGEEGIEGVCVNLYDAEGNLLQQTTTDSNGYYGFNVQPGKYTVKFVKQGGLEFTHQNAGDDSLDSDADTLSGSVDVLVKNDILSVDAGFVDAPGNIPTPDPSNFLPLAQVGPIRSGRLIYSYIAAYFENSCLIYASASPEVLARLPKCHMVFHQLSGGGYMINISEMEAVALQNRREKGSHFDYSSNLYKDQRPAHGVPASQLNVYIALQNQTGWIYDPLYHAYLRYVDTSEIDKAGILHADVDRLTGRQLHFENLVVLFTKHGVVTPTNLNIRLDQGKTGPALLFRDGQMFKIRWSTEAEQGHPGTIRPIQFQNPDDSPAALRPGHTWIIVVTPETTVIEKSPGKWQLTFFYPAGAQ